MGDSTPHEADRGRVSPAGVSITAARVAAHRLSFERPRTEHGDPRADELLAADVAAGADAGDLGVAAALEPVDSESRMGRYLRARTGFFDRVVIGALERGVRQFVNLGAGYDGRAWRYAAPEVHWWELDRPGTQDDKRRRLRRLAIDCGPVSFLPCDFAQSEGLADALVASGFESDAPALILAEGLLVYLAPAVIDALLVELRRLAAPGTRLALSLRADRARSAAREGSGRRADRPGGGAGDDGVGQSPAQRFERAVAAVGEPVANDLTAADFDGVLDRCGWARSEISERAATAGFLVVGPLFNQLPAGEPVSCLDRHGVLVTKLVPSRAAPPTPRAGPGGATDP